MAGFPWHAADDWGIPMKRKLLCYYMSPTWYQTNRSWSPADETYEPIEQKIYIDKFVTMRNVREDRSTSEPCLIIAMDVCPPRILRNDFNEPKPVHKFAPDWPYKESRAFWKFFKKENHRLPDIYVDLAGNIVRAKDGAVLMAAT